MKILIQSRLPDLIIIPETSYLRNKQRVDGPDITLIDRAQGQLIVIESKAKRVRAAVRVDPARPALIDDLKAAFDAFERLPQKVIDLYTGLPEYSPYQDIINETKAKDPMGVVVLGEGVYLMPELIHSYLQSEPNHFLNSYPFPFSFTHITSFEDAVELSAQDKISLSDVFSEYNRLVNKASPEDTLAEAYQNKLREKIFTKELTQRLFAPPH